MFTTLKKKIKEETGNDVTATPLYAVPTVRRHSSQRSSLTGNGSGSYCSNGGAVIELKDSSDSEMMNARSNEQYAELTAKYDTLLSDYEHMMADKDRLEKTNEILEEALKVAQVQKELIYNEQDKIQNIQMEEISKLKSLLHFREQEAVDRLASIKQKDGQLENFQNENSRLRELETHFEDIQDELEKLRHSSQQEKNNLTSTLASVEEQNRHLMSKLQIYEEARINFTSTASKDEKVQLLLRERRMLEQRLEEAHLHLSDIKSTWSAQNMALETQVDRLSRQVAAETTEKRKALKTQDEMAEKIKQITFQLEKAIGEIDERNQKIKLLSEEIDDLSTALREFKDENEEEVTFLRNKVEKLTAENEELKCRLESTSERLNSLTDENDKTLKSINARNDSLQRELTDVRRSLEIEKQEKIKALLKNAEISQSEERLKQELRNECHESSELFESTQSLQESLRSKDAKLKQLNDHIAHIDQQLQQQRLHVDRADELQREIHEKNKTIKVLNGRLNDMKKTLQQEMKVNNVSNGSTNSTVTLASPSTIAARSDNDKTISDINVQPTIVMDDVNFKYLKHVILKFLTSREVEARHLIRAIGTLLQLSHDEEQLLHDTLTFKVSWFSTRPTDSLTKNRHKFFFTESSHSSS